MVFLPEGIVVEQQAAGVVPAEFGLAFVRNAIELAAEFGSHQLEYVHHHKHRPHAVQLLGGVTDELGSIAAVRALDGGNQQAVGRDKAEHGIVNAAALGALQAHQKEAFQRVFMVDIQTDGELGRGMVEYDGALLHQLLPFGSGRLALRQSEVVDYRLQPCVLVEAVVGISIQHGAGGIGIVLENRCPHRMLVDEGGKLFALPPRQQALDVVAQIHHRIFADAPFAQIGILFVESGKVK